MSEALNISRTSALWRWRQRSGMAPGVNRRRHGYLSVGIFKTIIFGG